MVNESKPEFMDFKKKERYKKKDFVECSPPAALGRQIGSTETALALIEPRRRTCFPAAAADVGSENPEPGHHVATQELGESRVDEEARAEGGSAVDEGPLPGQPSGPQLSQLQQLLRCLLGRALLRPSAGELSTSF